MNHSKIAAYLMFVLCAEFVLLLIIISYASEYAVNAAANSGTSP